jgi:hypothetical protein
MDFDIKNGAESVYFTTAVFVAQIILIYNQSARPSAGI